MYNQLKDYEYLFNKKKVKTDFDKIPSNLTGNNRFEFI